MAVNWKLIGTIASVAGTAVGFVADIVKSTADDKEQKKMIGEMVKEQVHRALNKQ